MVLVETDAAGRLLRLSGQAQRAGPRGLRDAARWPRRGEDGAAALDALADALGAPTAATHPAAEAARRGAERAADAGRGRRRRSPAILPEGAIVSDNSVTSGQSIINATRSGAAARLAGADRRRDRPGHPGGGRRGGGRARPQGGVAERRRRGDVHGAGAVDAGARGPRRHRRGVRQQHLPHPRHRARPHRRRRAGPGRAACSSLGDPATSTGSAWPRASACPAVRCETAEAFDAAFARAMAEPGPKPDRGGGA